MKRILSTLILFVGFAAGVMAQNDEPVTHTYRVRGVSFTMVLVRGASFTMGALPNDNKAYPSETPRHQQTVNTFYMGQTEVTQALWQAVMGSNPSHIQGNPNLPVEMVSWDDCQEFIRKLNALTGEHFRLPTEAEWEYAARGGRQSHDYLYSGSNDISLVGWYRDNSGATSHPVAQKSPNELGLYDMTGNVWEMCADVYTRYDKKPFAEGSYLSTPHRSTRGGCYGAHQRDCRATDRGYTLPDFRGKYNGLRLAR